MVHVFIFRRDLRTHDNDGFNALLANTKNIKILPIFIFNPAQIDAQKNPYYTSNSVQFMCESILELKKELPSLRLFESPTLRDVDILNAIHTTTPISSITFNVDITPFARKRDAYVQAWCDAHKIPCHACETDYCLIHIQSMAKPYQVFTPFYNKYSHTSFKPHTPIMAVIKKSVFHPESSETYAYELQKNDSLLSYYTNNPNLHVCGGRSAALKILESLKTNKKYKLYETERNFPALDATTSLGAALKYGCVSVREVYFAFLKGHGESLVRELYWRAFYEQLTWWFPKVLDGSKSSLRESYDKIEWRSIVSVVGKTNFEAWKTGYTGFPLVDAGMRQLQKTGWMHNRVRMVVASFLTKDLLTDWRHGEKYFSNLLVDLYPSSNNGGWQWASGSGADAQQYTRIFNPWLQSKKYDIDAVYIKKWIPELSNVPVKAIHTWYKEYVNYDNMTTYPRPIVDHSVVAKEAIVEYKRALKNI